MELICTGCTVTRRCAISLLYVCSGAFALLPYFGDYFACGGNYWLYAAKAGIFVFMLYQVSTNSSVFNSSASYIRRLLNPSEGNQENGKRRGQRPQSTDQPSRLNDATTPDMSRRCGAATLSNESNESKETHRAIEANTVRRTTYRQSGHR